MIANALLALAAAVAVQTAPTPPTKGAAPGGPTAQAQPTGPIYLMEQIQTAKLPDAMMEKIKPLNTLAEIEAILKLNTVPFAWRIAGMQVNKAPPELIKQIDGLKPGDVFVLPEGDRLSFNVLRGKRP